MISDFFKNKKVLITGHTGFNGSMLCCMLKAFKADIYGYSPKKPSESSLFMQLGLGDDVTSVFGDIKEYDCLESTYTSVKPDIVIHLAAQPLVSEGYKKPRLTFETNIMGTVNILECVRKYGADSFLNVTSDKVYPNDGSGKLYAENDQLHGSDPYSNSKICSDIITTCYSRSFDSKIPISIARTSNIIGGGDFAPNRIVPDCIRALLGDGRIMLYNPKSSRTYQHVFESVYAYLTILKRQTEDYSFAGCYNVCPDYNDAVTTISLVNKIAVMWGRELEIEVMNDNLTKESTVNKLDNAKLKTLLPLYPVWNLDKAIYNTVEWTKTWSRGINNREITEQQLINYLNEIGETE